MAEFQEVIKNYSRMCKTIDCIDCQLDAIKNHTGYGCSQYIERYTEQAEALIMQWAKDNPIKTNADKFEEVFGFEPNTRICPNDIGCIGVCGECKYKEDFWQQEYREPERSGE